MFFLRAELCCVECFSFVAVNLAHIFKSGSDTFIIPSSHVLSYQLVKVLHGQRVFLFKKSAYIGALLCEVSVMKTLKNRLISMYLIYC